MHEQEMYRLQLLRLVLEQFRPKCNWGAYAENLAVILISGAPNINDVGSGHIVPHTLGNTDYSYQLEIAKKMTCAAGSIKSAGTAPNLIDFAIWEVLRQKKPAYIEIPCKMSSVLCAVASAVRLTRHKNVTDSETLIAAVEAANSFLQKSQGPIILVGPIVRAASAESDVAKLAEALGCGVVAKSFSQKTIRNLLEFTGPNQLAWNSSNI
jgi:pyruvate decarboxylase